MAFEVSGPVGFGEKSSLMEQLFEQGVLQPFGRPWLERSVGGGVGDGR